MTKENNITILIQKYLQTKCNQEELDSVIHFFQENENDEQLKTLLFDYWKNTPGFQHKIEKEELSLMLDSIHHKINIDASEDKNPLRKITYYAIRVAAILFIPLLVASLWMFYGNGIYNNDNSYITLETPLGSKLKTTLPDGTEVWQNAGTTLKYPNKFTKYNREVILNGEAYFHVSSDKKNPFYVRTADGTVKVTGTKFNVSSFTDDNFSSVVLEEGKVSFISANKADKTVELIPGEQIIYNRSSKLLSKNSTDVEKYTSWTQGKLIFRNDPLSDVITRLSRWYNTEIILQDKNGTLGNHPFTLTIQHETLDQVLEYISKAAGLHLEKQDSKQNANGNLIKTKYLISKTMKQNKSPI